MMGTGGIDQLIINTPFAEPEKHWRFDPVRKVFELTGGRRPAGYVTATPGTKSYEDSGIFIELPLVNQIRPRVDAWRKEKYPGVTGITKRLLEHWYDPENRIENRRFFFCQMEAIETIIWLSEAPESSRVGIDIPSDGGTFKRLCSKLATGTGKTVVMAMLIAWQVLNKVTYPQDKRFSKCIFMVAPGLTVKSRLQVLIPTGKNNYYEEFNVVPPGLIEKLRQGKIMIRNWHALSWETEERIAKRKSVDKRGAKSLEAYVRVVLGEAASFNNIVVINDEAHHAWRIPAESKVKGIRKEDIEEATKWIGGLDRIHKARGILFCFDFSATPFAPCGKKSSEEALFEWIVSDFGLNDAIESGLVKTPRIVVRDDGAPDPRNYRSRLFHIYNDAEVKDDLSRKAEPHESLPDLVTTAYYLLGKDWLEALQRWEKAGMPTPPVMITVCNRVETAARIKYAFDHKAIRIDELCVPEKILHIDSKALEIAESQNEAAELNKPPEAENDNDGESDEEAKTPKLTKQGAAELLRKTVDTVGQVGQPGEGIQKVISVGMLSEGWDAKTVTHIMGLRAFSSQLLCEQVVGRGLRRTSYETNPESGLYEPEYVNIFGVPFTFLPHENAGGDNPVPPTPKTAIEPEKAKSGFEISFPNVIRIDHTYKPLLTIDFEEVQTLLLDPSNTPTLVEMAPVVEGKPDVSKISEIDLEELGRKFRIQKIIFESARDVYDQIKPNWPGKKDYLLAQVIRLVEQFMESGKVRIQTNLFNNDELRRRILLTLNMKKIVEHVCGSIRAQNTETLLPVYDSQFPIRSTGDMRTWYTGKPTEYSKKSHINRCVFDSTWEACEAFHLDHNKNVEAWVKNDHIGFEVFYSFEGVIRKYRPDFIIRLKTGEHLIIETKGRDTQKDKVKREYLREWVTAVNNDGRFERWKFDVSFSPADIPDKIEAAIRSTSKKRAKAKRF